MKKNVVKLTAVAVFMVIWNVLYGTFESYMHCKYGAVQIDSGQKAMMYLTLMNYLNFLPIPTNAIFIGLIGHFIYKIYKGN